MTSPDEVFIIPVCGLPDNERLGILRGRLALKGTDLAAIFEPLIIEIISLVKHQIESAGLPIRAVLLVGGFGASNYLKGCLRERLDSGVLVLQPPNAWQAVVQGAVIKGLANCAPNTCMTLHVESRKARRHYGMELGANFDLDLHQDLAQQKYWCEFYGCWRVTCMHWFIKRVSFSSLCRPQVVYNPRTDALQC